ncbi:unnamed protein product [Lepeophtheirus salmonis]|uniref:(salmon louse) hypothetical protein n=1 Tax=Lepeophtheirus salmonis TaxID=72036 RepID=A0A7R8HDB2_LEPSM|nr:unnamed protein product [Lepeophtheirus salmonis]CAF3019878.1 unnamed protein product [Lepeophtheirus salmonis]
MSRPVEALSYGLSSCEDSSLRLTLRRLLSQVHTESSMEDIESLVKDNLPFAVSRYSEYEKVFADCLVALSRLNALLQRIDEHLTNSKEADSMFSMELFFAKLARTIIEADDPRTLTNTPSRCWYNIGDKPSIMTFVEASDKLEELSVKRKLERAVDLMAELNVLL